MSTVGERAMVRPAHTRDELHFLGSDLMRGSGQRVVSAWKHMALAGGGLLAHEKLFALIRSDIQSARAGDHGDQPHIAAWICRAYINLARSYGNEHWPLVALRESGAEKLAVEVWEHELQAYHDKKRFTDGKAANAAH